MSISNPPVDAMLAHRRVTTSFKIVSTHLYTWVERDTARVKPGLEPGPLNAETGDNHEATLPEQD